MLQFAVGLARPAPGRGRSIRDLVVVERQHAIPGLEDRRCGEHGHLLAIGAGDGLGEVEARFLVEVLERRDDEAGGQALEVPFPGRDGRLVEVVEVEDEPALGRGEAAEVQADGSRPPPAPCRPVRGVRGEIGRSSPPRRRAGRRRARPSCACSAAAAGWAAALALLDQDLDRVAAIGGAVQPACCSRALQLAQGAAACRAFVDRLSVGLSAGQGIGRSAIAARMARSAAGCRPCRPHPRACQSECD